MLKLSITHQTWLLSFALTLVLVVLIAPVILHEDELNQTEVSQISDKISAAYQAGGISKVEEYYTNLAANVYVVIEDKNGKVITSNSDNKLDAFMREINDIEPSQRVGQSSINYRYEIKKLSEGVIAYIAILQTPSKKDDPWLLAALFLGSVIIAAVLSLIWGVVIRRRLQSINHLTSQIIRSGDVSLRLPISSSSKDFDELENNLNSMLNKIETLMEDARSTGDAIAHDLRVPLTRLKGKLEAISPNNNIEQQLEEAHHEIDHIVTIFNALLRLSILESGKQMIKLVSTAVSKVVQDVVELYEPLAEDKNVTINLICSDVMINADKQLLFQAISNVVDNAIKYSPEGSTVSVRVDGSRQVCITVADHGAGVAPENLHKLTERFFRGDSSRTQAGTGLGLSLVKAVVKLHQGYLEFADNHPGLIVKLVLPKS